jgi:hypothetical protein
MKLHHKVLTVALSTALAGAALAETTTITTVTIDEPEVRTLVTDAGYGDPVLVEHEGDLWRVRSVDTKSDEEVTLFVTSDGRILGASEVFELHHDQLDKVRFDELETHPVSESTVPMIVMNAGFHNVHDIDYLAGKNVWKAEADDITGEDYEIHVDERTGRIVHIEDD